MSDLCNDELFDYENGRTYCYCQLPKNHKGHHKETIVVRWDDEGKRYEQVR